MDCTNAARSSWEGYSPPIKKRGMLDRSVSRPPSCEGGAAAPLRYAAPCWAMALWSAENQQRKGVGFVAPQASAMHLKNVNGIQFLSAA